MRTEIWGPRFGICAAFRVARGKRIGQAATLRCAKAVEIRVVAEEWAAFQEYAQVLKMDGRYPGALTSLAYLSYQFDKLDEAEGNYRAALKVNGDDPEALCGVAGIRFRSVMADLAVATDGGFNQQQRRRFIFSHSCIDARSRNHAGIEEGVGLVTKALQMRNGDVGLMSYLASLYWLRAEIECADPRAYNADMRIATGWDRAGYRR